MPEKVKIIDNRIEQTQYIPEFEELLAEYVNISPKNVLEIGSYYGSSLHHWLYYSVEGARVVSIDLPIRMFCGPQDPRCEIQENAIANEWKTWTKYKNNKLHLIQDMSQKESTLDAVKGLFGDEKLDFIFIDGNHMYEAVKMDLEIYSKLVRSGGIIALHDIGYAEEGGVHKLWDEIKNDYKHIELRLHPNKEKGIGILIMP